MTATIAVNKSLRSVPVLRSFYGAYRYRSTTVFSPCEIDNSRVMVFSSYVKQRIVFFRAKGYKERIKYSKRTELIMHEIGSARAGHRQG